MPGSVTCLRPSSGVAPPKTGCPRYLRGLVRVPRGGGLPPLAAQLLRVASELKALLTFGAQETRFHSYCFEDSRRLNPKGPCMNAHAVQQRLEKFDIECVNSLVVGRKYYQPTTHEVATTRPVC